MSKSIPWSAPRGGGRPGAREGKLVRTAEHLRAARYDDVGLEMDLALWSLGNGMTNLRTGRWPEDHAADIAESLALGGWAWDGRRIP